MCGRYVTTIWKERLGRWEPRYSEEAFSHLRLGYNVPPTSVVPVWLSDQTVGMHWGLIPRWSKVPKMDYPTFNARVETVAEKRSFRESWTKGQRCLLPARGYYEWRDDVGGKQPYFVHRGDGEPLVFAGLWERWQQDALEVLSCTILTAPSEGRLEALHPRRPCFLEPTAADEWLEGGNEAAASILKASPALDLIRFHPVSPVVGKVGVDDPTLIEPVVPEPPAQGELPF